MALLAKQNGASRQFRLDPYQARHNLRVGETSYKLDTKGVVVRKTLSCGLPATIAVPARAFKGVAARAVEDDLGNMTVTLELLHHDPQLCVPLLHADNMDDVSADWHSWSRLMKLPMLIIGTDDVAQSVNRQLGMLMVETPGERRKRITTPKHRPNFMRRRKPGIIGSIEKLTAAEIIARR